MSCKNPIDHRSLTLGMVHGFANWEVSRFDDLARIQVSTFDLHKVAYVSSTGNYFGLISTDPAQWHAIAGNDVTDLSYDETTYNISLFLEDGQRFNISLAPTVMALIRAFEAKDEELRLELIQYVNDSINTLANNIAQIVQQEIENSIEDAINENYVIKTLERNVKAVSRLGEEDLSSTIWDKNLRYYLELDIEEVDPDEVVEDQDTQEPQDPYELFLPIVSQDSPNFNPDETLESGGYLEVVTNTTISYQTTETLATIHDFRAEVDEGVFRTDKLLLLENLKEEDPNNEGVFIEHPIWILTSSNFQQEKVKVDWDSIEGKPEIDWEGLAEGLTPVQLITDPSIDFQSGAFIVTVLEDNELPPELPVGFSFELMCENFNSVSRLSTSGGESFSFKGISFNTRTIEIEYQSMIRVIKTSPFAWYIVSGDFTPIQIP